MSVSYVFWFSVRVSRPMCSNWKVALPFLTLYMISGGATPGRARSNDLAGRSTALTPALAAPLLCFHSVIVWIENKNSTISDRWPLYLFYFDSETISAALATFVFWGRRLKKVVNFFEEKVHPGDLARRCSDLEMTWLLAPPLYTMRATLCKLLTYRVLRSTQSPTLNRAASE